MSQTANKTLPFPSFFDTNKVGELYYSRDAEVAAIASAYAKANGITPAFEDKNKVALFVIDGQVGFCWPGASLFVPGAVEDVTRICEFIYRNLNKISEMHFSLDTHKAFQIFHPSFWIDNATGEAPGPFTLISAQDIKDGKYTPALYPHECLAYCEELEKTGKYVLCVWPYHTMLGSIGHALLPALFEAAMFHAIARKKQTKFETKGMHPLTENYSVLSPEVKNVKGQVVGQFNTRFFKALMENDRVYICGQASSHCVKTTIEDLLREIMAVDPDLVKKVYILEDCMSPVPAVTDADGNVLVDFPAMATQALADFKAAGMNVVLSTESVVL
ncbi:nicotinamidase [Candidatus Kuenenbacteria bacterium]|nr:nicotinamidase [Candidatus Kuenenbacteria bacterium]